MTVICPRVHQATNLRGHGKANGGHQLVQLPRIAMERMDFGQHGAPQSHDQQHWSTQPLYHREAQRARRHLITYLPAIARARAESSGGGPRCCGGDDVARVGVPFDIVGHERVGATLVEGAAHTLGCGGQRFFPVREMDSRMGVICERRL